MKQIVFFLFLVPTIFLAQNVVWEDNFDDTDITDWTLIDADGDGNNWSAVQIADNDGNPVWTPVLRSASWVSANGGTPLTPDNWAVSPAIDLSSASGTVELKWQIAAIDADWDAENYSVYVATSNTIDDLSAASLTFNETTLEGVNVLTDRVLDISSMAGQATVYVAFRHYNVSDQFTIELDNVKVEAAALGVEDIQENTGKPFTYYPNPVQDVLQIQLSDGFDAANTRVSITDMNGKLVSNQIYQESMDVSSLEKGLYLLTITDGINTQTEKLIKK